MGPGILQIVADKGVDEDEVKEGHLVFASGWLSKRSPFVKFILKGWVCRVNRAIRPCVPNLSMQLTSLRWGSIIVVKTSDETRVYLCMMYTVFNCK